jgi:hypothetical protein
MTNGSTGEKIKEKVTGSKDKVKEKVMGTKDKVKETVGMGGGRGGGEGGAERKEGQLGPGAASEVEEEIAKTSSDSPTKRVEGPGKALGKEEKEGAE